ncbi:type VII secretion integral membrane protein EccD [Microbacterium halimionae]|uniref:Type VII secretion integral membrane protein EccD n=1 Tax=Microbacterium halimionae TaxID=1526413 RepID=A0A7W3JLJ1_9MICO|nr:EsaB/YukD family protein [Microbacterium halimionae]MBA8815035.1 type VII secretion integral membrane protein EccD [Microbacterium halimionae]NII94174.1 type VII secretion integral membrane protein EccD [Microbacterium halimionae]
MAQIISASRALLRISVQSEGRRLDIGVPAHVPLIEFMPGFARSLGVLDPTLTYAGYGLQRADGSTLDVAQGAAAQSVEDGAVLTLTRGGLLAQPRVYDDIVEAVIDATGRLNKPWTPQDNARTALAVSLTLLGLCALLLLAAGPSLSLGALMSGGGAVVLLVIAAVISRLGQVEAGQGFGIAAAVFASLTGYLVVPASFDLWGWPLGAAGLAMMLSAGISLALLPERSDVQLVPLVVGGVVGVTAVLAALLPGTNAAPFALMIGIVATLGGSLPWLALSSTRIRVISPQSDAEMFDDPAPINAEDVAERAVRGQRILVALRISLGIAVLAATPLVAAQSPLGALLCALAFVSMMFPARQAFARSSVLAVMVLATVGLAVSGLTTSITQPDLRVILIVTVAVAAVLVVTLTVLSPKARVRMTRLADVAELVILAVLLPIGVIAAGLV